VIILCDFEAVLSVSQCSLQPNVAATGAVVGLVALLAGLQDHVNLARRIVPNPDLLSTLRWQTVCVVGASAVDNFGVGGTAEKERNTSKESKKRRCAQSLVLAHDPSPLETPKIITDFGA
jgi:hypothetical protein